MHPRYGRAPAPGRRYIARPGAYAVLPRGGKVLLTLELDGDREVQLPGGGIEPGESPVRSLHREVFEETGWRIDRPRRIGLFRRFTFMPDYDIWAEKICHIYLAWPAMRLGPPTEPQHRPFWAARSKAASLVENAGDAAFLRRVLGS